MAEANGCYSFQLIDGDGNFDAQRLGNFIEEVKLSERGVSYVVVSVMGKQSSGKSTLLNHLFHTNFEEMNAFKRRGQITKGIWMARGVGIEPCTIVMDLEGTDGKEREDDTAFEKQSALFALLVSDIVLVNMWCKDIGLQQAGNRPLLKIVFQVMLQLSSSDNALSNPRKKTLVFVLRDKNKSPLTILEPDLRKDVEEIWNSVPKPKVHKRTPLSKFFEVEVVALSNYEENEEMFKGQVADFRQRFFHSIAPGGLACDRQGVVPASAFSINAEEFWKVIKENRDLNLPTHKEMVATIRCEQIVEEKYSSFCTNEGWLNLREKAQSHFVPNFGRELSSMLDTCLSSYDEVVIYFDEGVRSAKRKKLEDSLLQLVQLAYQSMLERIHSETMDQFKRSLGDDLSGGLGFSVAACDCKVTFMREFDEKCKDVIIKETNWDSTDVRDKLLRDIDAHIGEVRTARLHDLSAKYESTLSKALCEPVKALLRDPGDHTWPAIRNLLSRETDKAVLEFSGALADFDLDEQEKNKMLLDLENAARGIVEKKARKEATSTRVLRNMTDRFRLAFKHNDDLMPRVWTGKEDIPAIVKKAKSCSLVLLSVLAAIRLDEDADNIRDTLDRALLKDKSEVIGAETNFQDPLASIRWEEVPERKTLITPVECKSLWNQFVMETRDDIIQANAAQMEYRARSSWSPSAVCEALGHVSEISSHLANSTIATIPSMKSDVGKAVVPAFNNGATAAQTISPCPELSKVATTSSMTTNVGKAAEPVFNHGGTPRGAQISISSVDYLKFVQAAQMLMSKEADI